ncbi:MAG: FHA domain-containing protein [Desulfobacteraceae bacterium]|nr:FHA domain-containing protein [Desulfobacteraceae bacterium]
MAKLIIRSSEGTREVTLEESNSVGRSSANRVRILDPLVSKSHCLIHMGQDGKFRVRDLGSRNGTFLNKKRIESETVLENGDEISIGMTSCLFLPGSTESVVELEDDRCQIVVFDKVLPSALRQDRFLPEKDIGDEKALRADYEKLRVAVELQRDIGLELNLNRICNRILARTFEFLECDQAVILMAREDGRMELEAYKTTTQKDQVVISSTLVQRVREEKAGLISADALADERFQNALSIVSQKVRSSMAVPILYEEDLLGIMIIESSAAVMAYSKKDLLLFTNIAHQTANLIKMAEMAKRIEAEAVTRERFQRLLSPDLAEMVVSGKLKVEKGGENRTATVLFSDIRGFTSMCENMTPAEVLAMLNEHFEIMVEIAFRYEGTVDKFVGDMIMVVWGAPVAHSDDPVRALRAALEMQAALEEYNKSAQREIRVGIGVNTDELVAGYIGSSRTMSYSVLGDAVNIASRLCSAAGPGQILISDNTYRQVKDCFEVEVLNPIRVKGKSKPLKVYGVLKGKAKEDAPDLRSTQH